MDSQFIFDMKIATIYWFKLNNQSTFFEYHFIKIFPIFQIDLSSLGFRMSREKKEKKMEIESENCLTMEITIFQERQ